MDNWKKVEDGLPKENAVVEAELIDGEVVYAHRYVATWWYKRKKHKKWHADYQDYVIKWREIPQVPLDHERGSKMIQ